MNDLISRQAAIDAVKRVMVIRDKRSVSVCDAIKELPSAQPTGEDIQKMQDIEQAALEKAYECGKQDAMQWIPCKERLPEDYTDVLVWFEYYRYGDYNRLYQMHGIGNYMSEYDSWMINHETGWRKLRVFAWMPLPEPYKEHPDADHN